MSDEAGEIVIVILDSFRAAAFLDLYIFEKLLLQVGNIVRHGVIVTEMNTFSWHLTPFSPVSQDESRMNIESLPETTRERWRTMGQIFDILEREAKASHKPLLARVVTWFNMCVICRDYEDRLLFIEPTDADTHLHRALFSICIGVGERLLMDCGDSAALAPLGITADSIDAQLYSLRITYDMRHSEFNPEEAEAIIKEVFGEGA
jgi:hypothetical protein